MIITDKSLKENVFRNHEKESLSFIFYYLYYNTPLHWHEQVEFLWVKKGSMTVTVNTETFTAEEGTIHLIPSGSLHSYTTDGCVHRVFLADKSVFEKNEIYEKYISPFFQPGIHHISTKANDAPEIINLFSQLGIEYSNQAKNKDTYHHTATTLLSLFFMLWYRRFNPAELFPEKNLDHFKKAILYINNHYAENITLEDVASHAGFSASHFSRVFKSCCNMTFKQYLIIIRLKKAHALLLDTNLSIEEIAFRTGFNDACYFTKMYKRHFSSPPSSIRKQ